MKRYIIVIAFLGLMTLIACDQERKVESMLEDEETRTEIFSSINDNPVYLNSFRNYMQEHHGNSQMMMGKSMRGMNRRGGMMNMEDSTLMMRSFMKDPRMMGNMVEMMHSDGMMSEDCMNQAMSHINEDSPVKK